MRAHGRLPGRRTTARTPGGTCPAARTTSASIGTDRRGTEEESSCPQAAAGPGLDLALTATYRITPTFEALAGFDVRRYILTTSGSSSSRINATYLTDQSLAGWIGIGAVFGGT